MNNNEGVIRLPMLSFLVSDYFYFWTNHSHGQEIGLLSYDWHRPHKTPKSRIHVYQRSYSSHEANDIRVKRSERLIFLLELVACPNFQKTHTSINDEFFNHEIKLFPLI
jgi:hypothetical protein